MKKLKEDKMLVLTHRVASSINTHQNAPNLNIQSLI